MSRRSFRERLPAPRHEPYFRWRGKEVSRLEGLADAVFAFAVTLLIVALEVPRTFEGLVDALRGFPAFVVCFALLMILWNAHYRYFRRYGMEDTFTRIITLGILLMVLFSVYPLKFLFSSVLQFGAHEAPHLGSISEWRFVYTIYGVGFSIIWGLYALLYHHALKKKDVLGLNYPEILQTKSVLGGLYINIAVAFLSVFIAHKSMSPGLPGLVYCLLLPALLINGFYFGRKVRACYEDN